MSNFRSYVEFTKIAEGGLSKAKTDTASKDPVPDGSGYHTNKGVTWTTFKRLAPVLDYAPLPSLFYKMPENIFLKIFEQYWIAAGSHLIESQGIANIVMQSAWGGGHSNLVKAIQKFFGLPQDGILGKGTAAMINCYPDKLNLYKVIHNARLAYLRSLSSYKYNGKGWESRMRMMYKHNTAVL